MYINIYTLCLIGFIIFAVLFAFTIALVSSRRNNRTLSYQVTQLKDNQDLFPREGERFTMHGREYMRNPYEDDYTINITGTQIN